MFDFSMDSKNANYFASIYPIIDFYSFLLILFCLNSSSQMETASFLDTLFPSCHAATLKANLCTSASGSLGSIITP